MYMYNESGSISFIPDYEFLSGSPKKKTPPYSSHRKNIREDMHWAIYC